MYDGNVKVLRVPADIFVQSSEGVFEVRLLHLTCMAGVTSGRTDILPICFSSTAKLALAWFQPSLDSTLLIYCKIMWKGLEIIIGLHWLVDAFHQLVRGHKVHMCDPL